MTTYRDSCGTARGAAAHQGAGEVLCGWCIEAEAVARARAESVPRRPSPAPDSRQALLEPVTAKQAAINRAVLVAEVEAFEQDHPNNYGRRVAALRVVPGSAA